MKKLDNLITEIDTLKTFDTTGNPLQPRLSVGLKGELLDFLTEIQSDIDELHKCKSDTTKIQLASRDTLVNIYKDRVDYLEDFIVRLSRETKDL